MGFWGYKLYENDLTVDIKDTYISFLEKGLSNNDALKMTLKEYGEILKSDEESLLWYALAQTQWKLGRLDDSVLSETLLRIDNSGGIDLFCTETEKEKWLKTLKKLRLEITSPQPAEKKIKLLAEITNPWNVGDIYAYRLQSKEAKKCNQFGNFILIQKIGEIIGGDDELLSRVQVFNKVFADVPKDIEISKLDILPFCENSVFTDSEVDNALLNYNFYFQILYNSDYPQKQLTFIKNESVNNEYPLAKLHFGCFHWGTSFEQCFLNFYDSWKGHKCQIINGEISIE